MSLKKASILFAAAMIARTAFSQVPPARTHMPDVPFFLESMVFRSLQMAVFPAAAVGMIDDPYSDLIWNPAFVLRQDKKSVYLTLNTGAEPSWTASAASSDYRNFYRYSSDKQVMTYWSTQSSIANVNNKPLYNIAAIIPLNPRFSLSVMNRTIFDYSPYRSMGLYDWRDSNYGDAPSTMKKEPQRLSVDKDQQRVFGNQFQVSLGYRLSDKIQLGLRWGLFTYDRDGDVHDSDKGIYPHSSFDNLLSETLGIKGHHLEAGVGLLWQLDNKTRLGFYGGLTWGKGEESLNSRDRNSDWSENERNPAYYRRYDNDLTSAETHPADGSRPDLALTFERDFSEKLRFRSFFSFTWSNNDLKGSALSEYASSWDTTYDYYDGDSKQYFFRRSEYRSRSRDDFSGTGKEKTAQFKGFASLAYAPANRWAFFGGVQIQRGTYSRDILETTAFLSESETAHTLYRPGTENFHHSYQKNYDVRIDYDQWAFFLPLGMRFEINKGLYVILGTDLTLILTEGHDRGDVDYISKITRRWENGRLIVNDEEFNRSEVFRSDSPKTLERHLGNRFGIVYEFNSLLAFHLRCEDDVTRTSNWACGFEIRW
jgi:hypothetical protein